MNMRDANAHDPHKPVIIIAGPTASGKSGLALGLAQALEPGGVIINADSMQLYKELRLVTARPDAKSEAAVPHRLYGVLAATDSNSAGHWRDMALAEIEAAHAVGMVPILVGGTGFYIKALTEGLSPIPPVPEQIELDTRDRLAAEGAEALHAALKERDPVMGRKLAATDSQRVARAWSVLQATGMSLAEWQKLPLNEPPDDLRFIVRVVMPERAGLYRQCDARFAIMAAAGAVDEVRALLALGLPEHLPLMKAVGVPELRRYIEGQCGLEEAIAAGQQATRNYAKRQFTWFRNQLRATPENPRHIPKLQISHVHDAQLSESFVAEIENIIK